MVTMAMDCGPLLSMAVQAGAGEKGVIYTGGIDGSVKRFDIASNSVSTIGMHSPNIAAISGSEKKVAVSCLAVVGDGLLASAGWDGKFHLWDIRSDASDDDIATIKKKKPVATIDLPGKAFSMDISPDATKVVIATSGRRNVFVDVANLQQRTGNDENSNPDNDNEASSGGGIARVLLDRESSLKYQTRCIKFLSDGRGIAVGSIEGRVAIEYLDDIGIPSGEEFFGVVFGLFYLAWFYVYVLIHFCLCSLRSCATTNLTTLLIAITKQTTPIPQARRSMPSNATESTTQSTL